MWVIEDLKDADFISGTFYIFIAAPFRNLDGFASKGLATLCTGPGIDRHFVYRTKTTITKLSDGLGNCKLPRSVNINA
jgi:hypothetical protein